MKKSYTRISMAALAVLAASVSVTGCGSSKSSADKDNELYVYNWGEYIDESVISQFEEETGIKVIYDMFETNEEMYPIIEAGAISYDAVCPSDYMIQKMVQNDLLAELNFDNIPNIKEIDPLYLQMASTAFDPENKYAVPYTWGDLGILYNDKRLEELGIDPPTKWSDLWDERLSGELLMQDSIRSAFTIALTKNGYSLNTTNPDEIARTVSEEFGTGLTILDAHGFYSDTPKTVLYVVVNRFQTVKLKTFVKAIDPNAYMAISPVADLLHGSKEESA